MGVLGSHCSGLKRTLATPEELKCTVETRHGAFRLDPASHGFLLGGARDPAVHVLTRTGTHTGIVQERSEEAGTELPALPRQKKMTEENMSPGRAGRLDLDISAARGSLGL